MTILVTQRFTSRATLDQALAERLGRALAARDPCAVMLAGGQTPMPAYRALAARRPQRADGLRVLFTDERYVPPDSTASNYHQSRPLLDALALAPPALLRVRTELPLPQAAADYELQLRELLASGAPVTLALLGLGGDGHTASLFSAADLERARGRLAIDVQRPDGLSAVSVTPEFLARVAQPLFAVAGSGKRAAIQALIAEDATLVAWRAVQGCPQVELWLDPAAEGS
jgi:6-phosphogluconolactonase